MTKKANIPMRAAAAANRVQNRIFLWRLNDEVASIFRKIFFASISKSSLSRSANSGLTNSKARS